MRNPGRWELWQLPRPLQVVLIGQLLLAGLVAVAAVGWSAPPTRQEWLLLALLLGAGLFSERLAARIGTALSVKGSSATGNIVVSSCTVWIFVAVVACPLLHVAILSVLLCLSDDLRVRRSRPADMPHPPHRIVFNAALAVVTFSAGSGMYGWLSSVPAGHGGAAGQLGAALAGFLTVHLLTQATLALVMMLVRGGPYRYPVSILTYMSLEEGGLASLGLLLAVAWRSDPLLIAAGVPVITLLQQALLHNQLRESAGRDPKTGLVTAARWREIGDEALVDAAGDKGSVGVLLVDLDHFKSVNDTYGHLAGDDVLRSVAAAMESTVREGDVVGRFGGEEFVVLLHDASRAEVAWAAERMRAAIAATRIPVQGLERPLRITTSVGAAVFPADGQDLDELLEQADKALYAAKHGGRNRVVCAAEAAPPDIVPVLAAPRAVAKHGEAQSVG